MTTQRAARTVMLATTAWVFLIGSALGQASSTSGAAPSTTGQAPSTMGQAPREIQTPSSGGHRQPTAKDAPGGDEAASHAANQEIDRRLNICRGC